MNAEGYLAFLADHQPMPGDADIEDGVADAFTLALKHFEAHPDPRCIPLFIGSVAQDTGLGMYEHIRFVLQSHNASDVLPHLRVGLGSSEPGRLYRCCSWALDLEAWGLADLVLPLEAHSDQDVRDAVEMFRDFKPEKA